LLLFKGVSVKSLFFLKTYSFFSAFISGILSLKKSDFLFRLKSQNPEKKSLNFYFYLLLITSQNVSSCHVSQDTYLCVKPKPGFIYMIVVVN